jgi:hypothetical protein
VAIDATVNVVIVGSFGLGALFSIIEVDSDISTGWTWWEVTRHIPADNLAAYQAAGWTDCPYKHKPHRTAPAPRLPTFLSRVECHTVTLGWQGDILVPPYPRGSVCLSLCHGVRHDDVV